MTVPEADTRNDARKRLDEQIAAESPLSIPDVTGHAPAPLEAHLGHGRPIAIVGVVENGLVRPLDPSVRLPERTRVIIVARDAV